MNIIQIAPHNLGAFLTEHPEAVLLDVRQPWEHELVALEDSKLFPLGILAERAEDELPDKSIPIVVYCRPR